MRVASEFKTLGHQGKPMHFVNTDYVVSNGLIMELHWTPLLANNGASLNVSWLIMELHWTPLLANNGASLDASIG